MKISSYNSNYAIQKQPNFKANITNIDSKAKKFFRLIKGGSSFLNSLRLDQPKIQKIKFNGQDLNIALSANDEFSKLYITTSFKKDPDAEFFSIITKKELSSKPTAKYLESFCQAVQRGINPTKSSIGFKTGKFYPYL